VVPHAEPGGADLIKARTQDSKRRRWRRNGGFAKAGAGRVMPGLAVLLLIGAPTVAHAELKLCNMTQSRVGIAVGYRDEKAKQWVTEGWWNVLSHGCETLLRQKLDGQFYYIYAVDYDRGGAWEGKDPRFTMCIADKSFTITGLADCAGRGYKQARFLEVDTGQADNFTIRLTEPAAPVAAAGSP
jgi:uncharacterized membrane protein